MDSPLIVSVPIAARDRQYAQDMAQQAPTPEQTEQEYRSLLAMLVTRRYLQTLAIAADFNADRWHQLQRWLDHSAGLEIVELKGVLECRSIHAGERKCAIPATVMDDRIGYVVVQLDEPYREGKLLGFVPSVSVTELPLSYLQPMDALIDHLFPAPIELSQWLDHQIDQVWQAQSDLLQSLRSLHHTLNYRTSELTQIKQLYQQANLAFSETEAIAALKHLIDVTENDEIRWKAAELLWNLEPEHPASPVIRAKDLGLYLAGETIALMVGVMPKSDGKRLILLRLYPSQNQAHLPTGLKLIGLDEAAQTWFELESGQRYDYLQFKFTADPGDRFGVKVAWHEVSVVEHFVA